MDTIDGSVWKDHDMTVYNLISLFGIFVLLFLGWLASRNHRTINWRLIVGGVAVQLAFAFFVFQVPAGRSALWVAGQGIDRLVSLGTAGSKFVFGPLAEPAGEKSLGFVLAFQGFPVIIFFSALMALLYYLRIMPLIIRAFAWFFAKVLRVSGAESLYAASQVFGGVESAAAVRPYLRSMTNSELHCLVTAGLATVAVNILGLYIGFLKDLVPDVAGHLISASILGAPAALVAAKLVWPEDENPETLGRVPPIALDNVGSGVTESVITGAMDGVRLIVGIAALLIAFLGLLALANAILTALIGRNLEQLLGYVFWPLSLAMGVPAQDAQKVGQLLGLRTIATEVASYSQLADWLREGKILDRSALIAVYALCGFAHVASVAVFVGGTAALIPERRSDLAKVAFRALLAGTLATLLIGAVAGTCYTSEPLALSARP